MIKELKLQFPGLKNAILSSVTNIEVKLTDYLKSDFEFFQVLTHKTELPIVNMYKSKETLGYDRIAAVTGASCLFPGCFLMVIDAGTALTFDFIDEKKVYAGGTISLGLAMRFIALNKLTEKLPLVTGKENFEFTGSTTEESIISGVQNGMIFEIEKYTEVITNMHPGCKIVLTGGDAKFLAKIMKKSIFVEPNLVFYGLSGILDYNIELLKKQAK